MNGKSLSFVIPVYNEAESLQILHKKIVENVQNYSYEIIFIDDGSKDGSYQELEKIRLKDDNVNIIKMRTNFGKSSALQAGFDKAEGDVIFTIDADLQDDPSEIPKFLDKLSEGYDLVVGWKKRRKDPLSKRIPSKFFNFVSSRVFHLKLHDYNCGFKAYRKEVVKSLNIYGELHRYIPALANAKGFKVAEVPVVHHKRKYGVSKYGAKRFLRGFLDLLTVMLVTKYGMSPLYLFGLAGVLTFLIGLIIDLYLAIGKIFFNMPLSNRPLLFLGVLLIIVGMQFISIGLLGEMIVHRTKILENKPNYSIEKVMG